MIKFLWQKLTSAEKVFITLLAILSIIILVLVVKLAIAEHRLIKSIKNNIERVETKIDSTEINTKNTINQGKKANVNALNKKKSIDNKLKKGEAIIDNTDYSDNRLDSLLAGYEN